MDEPSSASVEAWLQEWMLVTKADADGRIEAAMTSARLKRDSELSTELAWARRRQLMLLRGLQLLLDKDQDGARTWVASPFSGAPKSPSAPGSPCRLMDFSRPI